MLTQHSALGLEELSNSTIEPLSSLALIPTVAEDVPFEHKEPRIKLYLANNSLSRVPGAVFNIENLTVLSLRGNCLGELPPSIGKLRNLQALNVAQNKLKCLPAELLSLMGPRGSLEDLVLHPNPFYQPDNLPFHTWGSLDYETLTFGATDTNDNTSWTGYSTSLRSRSPVQFSGSTGTIYSDFHLEPTAPNSNLISCEDFWSLAMPSRAPWQSRSQAFDLFEDPSTRVPTLFELALRAASQAPEIEELADQVAGLVPQHIPPLLKRAARVRETGGQSCCICHQQVVVPQTEWLEWRQVFHCKIIYDSSTSTRNSILRTYGNQDGNTIWVPFLRKGCSWKCVPQTAKKPPQPEYTESEPFEP